MAELSWNGGSGDWTAGSHWTGGFAPTSADDAVINGSGSPFFKVTIDAGVAAASQSLSLDNATLEDDGALTVAGALSLNASTAILGGGALTAASISGDAASQETIEGYGSVNATLSAADLLIMASGGLLSITGDASPTGVFIVATNSTLELALTGTAGSIDLVGPNATLKIDTPASFASAVGGLIVSDVIDLAGVNATSVAYAGGVLTIAYGTNHSLSYDVSGSLTGDVLVYGADGAGGTRISWTGPAESWTGGAGDWTNGAHWTSGAAPIAASDAVINGMGNAASSDSIAIAAGETATAHSLALNAAHLVDDGALTVGVLNLSAALVTLAGGSLTATSIVSDPVYGGAISGYGALSGDFSGLFSIEASGGALFVSSSAPATGNGLSFYIAANNTLELAISGIHGVNFEAAGATLKLDAPASFDGTISNLSIGDVIDLVGVSASAVSDNNGTLTVAYGAGQSLSYKVTGALSGDSLVFGGDGAGGTRISWAPPPVSWTAGSGDWTVGANWANGSAPTAADDAVIDGAGPDTNPLEVTIGAGVSAAAQSLSLHNATLIDDGVLVISGTLSLSSGITLAGGSLSASTISDGPDASPMIFGYGSVDAGFSTANTGPGSLLTIWAHGGALRVTEGPSPNALISFLIDPNSTLELNGPDGQVGAFGNGATLKLDIPTSFSSAITGMSVGDVIDLVGVNASTVTYSGGRLIIDYGVNQSLSYLVSGAVTGDVLVYGGDGAGGTRISWAAPNSHGVFNDFSGDSHADLLFANTGGLTTVWDVTGSANLTETRNTYVAQVDPAWQVQGSMDVNGDGLADLVWRNTGSGMFTIWESTGQGFAQNAIVGQVDPGWTMAGLGDFNGDGKDDILWRNAATGTFTIWSSTGTGFTQNTYVDSSVDPSWHVQAVADFNGDGKADILFRNSSGYLTEWQSNGSGFTENVFTTGAVDTSWHVAAVGDFNGDGKADLIFRNTSGLLTEWQSTGSGFTQNVYVAQVDPSWALVGAYDFNGDGKADLLFRNSSTGTFTVWESTGSGFTQNALVDGSVSSAWQIVTHHYDTV